MEISYSYSNLAPKLLWLEVEYEGIAAVLGQDSWFYGDNYWDLVVAFLNLDAIGISTADDPRSYYDDDEGYGISLKKRHDCVERELSQIDYVRVKSLVDHVLLSSDFSGITAAQRFSAYWHSFDDAYDVLRYETCVTPISGANSSCDYALNRSAKNRGERGFRELCKLYSENPNTITYGYSTYFDSLEYAVKYFLHMMIKNDVCLKICPNCGRYFVPANRSDTKYCNKSAPQDNARTCQAYMKYANFLDKSRNDEATRLYKQIYNSKNNKVRRCNGENTLLNADLQGFVDCSKQWKADVKARTKTEAEYIEWLKAVKEKKVL